MSVITEKCDLDLELRLRFKIIDARVQSREEYYDNRGNVIQRGVNVITEERRKLSLECDLDLDSRFKILGSRF